MLDVITFRMDGEMLEYRADTIFGKVQMGFIELRRQSGNDNIIIWA